MAKRRVKRRDEILTRTAEITTFDAGVGWHVDQRRGLHPEIETMTHLRPKGMLNEPVRDVRDVEFSLFPKNQRRRAY